jgi:DNA repair protein RecN (Recombination protein N)
VAALTDDGGALDGVRLALAAVQGRAVLGASGERLHALAAELDDVAADLRATGEAIEDDPERLAWIGERRAQLRELRRKYGDTLADVLAFQAEAEARLAELEGYEARAARLDGERAEAQRAVAAAAGAVAEARRAEAPKLAAAVQRHLRALAMPRARLEVTVGEEPPGDEVTFLLGANPGEPALPLAKVASGGELARAMLALRLVLTEAPDTLVFDEVDAGVGGEAALAVGRALAALGARHQVLVVTHLPQVAAFADAQVAVSKRTAAGRTVAEARPVQGEDRVRELSRMLAGLADSSSARSHAEELLAAASRRREA